MLAVGGKGKKFNIIFDRSKVRLSGPTGKTAVFIGFVLLMMKGIAFAEKYAEVLNQKTVIAEMPEMVAILNERLLMLVFAVIFLCFILAMLMIFWKDRGRKGKKDENKKD